MQLYDKYFTVISEFEQRPSETSILYNLEQEVFG